MVGLPWATRSRFRRPRLFGITLRALAEAISTGYDLIICQAPRLAVCPVALMTGDLAAAELGIARLVEIGRDVPFYKSAARYLEGKLLVEQGAFEAGPVLMLLASKAPCSLNCGSLSALPV